MMWVVSILYECFLGIHFPSSHDFAPCCAEMGEERLEVVAGVTKVLIIDFFDAFLIYAGNDAFKAKVRDGLLDAICLLQLFHNSLVGHDVKWC